MERYIEVQAIITEKNEIILIWDDRLEFNEHEDGNYVCFENEDYYSFKSVLFDLKKNKVKPFEEFTIKSEITLKRQIGEEVFVDIGNKIIGKTKIIDIIYKIFTTYFYKGIDVPTYYLKHLEKVENKQLYRFLIQTPFYLLENGKETCYEWEFYTIQD